MNRTNSRPISPEQATTAAIINYWKNERAGQVELVIYARHCFISGNKPSFSGYLTALNIETIRTSTNQIIYRRGFKVKRAELDTAIVVEMQTYLVWLRRYRKQAFMLSVEEANHLQQNGLRFLPLQPKS